MNYQGREVEQLNLKTDSQQKLTAMIVAASESRVVLVVDTNVSVEKGKTVFYTTLLVEKKQVLVEG